MLGLVVAEMIDVRPRMGIMLGLVVAELIEDDRADS